MFARNVEHFRALCLFCRKLQNGKAGMVVGLSKQAALSFFPARPPCNADDHSEHFWQQFHLLNVWEELPKEVLPAMVAVLESDRYYAGMTVAGLIESRNDLHKACISDRRLFPHC